MSHPYVELARQAIRAVTAGDRPTVGPLPPELDRGRPVFVSLHGPGGALRGCVGHTDSDEPSMAREIVSMAVAAAQEDTRFSPVRPEELATLDIEVSVLGPHEPVTDLESLDPRRYGVVISDGRRRAVLLPDLPGIDTVEQQLSIARRKAGISPDAPIRVDRFEVEVYR
ncbi:MAG: AmmeMemoRadiSam system protein A [Alphaproteobacteria bacterium]|nr:AmmeMemoRadiSam system protein A [Alphaproteobacteria bacterium]